MKKIATVIGARPQFIKMALVSGALTAQGIDEVAIHTGQHYDREMSGAFFDELKILKPKYNLGAGSGTHAEQTARMLIGIEKILIREKPDIVLVYGDTNSTLAASLAASKLGIRIAHIEAGLRSHDLNMPEEINRVVTDAISSIFFCPTKIAVENLKKEGKTSGVYLVGDVMYDSVKNVIAHSSRLIGKKVNEKRPYALCTIHRAENTDSRCNLDNIFKALGLIEENVVVPLHPRTVKYVSKYAIKIAANIKIIKPVGYVEMLSLEKDAAVIITDSGGVQKEALIFGVPCVTLRDKTEWGETLQCGANRIAGSDPKTIAQSIEYMCKHRKRIDPRKFYGDGNAHKRIARILNDNLKKW